ncbi:DUF547 domain-containing protein [Flagellimonas lutimaris]|uniref:DUF547 domain-containing protein n=1 Tax=Flagellimonas lutimaris TaxID=475082 RepID=UPI003F5CF533
MKYLVLSVLIFTPLVFSQSLPIEQNFSQTGELNSHVEDKYPDHTLWQFLLDKYVDDSGHVDYSGFLKDKQVLEGYLNILEENQPNQHWDKNEKLSYYINLYNAYTVLLILDNYPIKSIKKINKPWDQKLIPLDGSKISLGDLEHKILRKMEEPRIHFAINCASASCPKLLNKVYLPKTLDQQLDRAAHEFINSERNQISQNHLKLSKIFKWYKNDFLNGDIQNYINTYTNINISQNAKVDYLEYDWNLNGM